MDITELRPEQVNIAEAIALHHGLVRLHTQVEIGSEFHGYETMFQNGLSYLENRNKQITIWRDDKNAMLARVATMYPSKTRLGYSQTISDFEVSYDGSQVSHVRSWPFEDIDNPDLPYRTEELDVSSCNKLQLTIDELDNARKNRSTTLLGRAAAGFHRLFNI